MTRMAACALAAACGMPAIASPPLEFADPIPISVQPVAGYDGEASQDGGIQFIDYLDGEDVYHTILLSVYLDAQGPEAWDYTGTMHPARDVFVTRSLDCGLTWSQPVNLSNTAGLSSIFADHDGDPLTEPIPYPGDSIRPNVIVGGQNILVTWIDRYIPEMDQRTVVYQAFDNVEVPFAAVYAVRSLDAGATWSDPQILTTGYRDAMINKASASADGVMITWQEDPQGLCPCTTEPPKDTGEGALVHNGTDIWYTALTRSAFLEGEPFPEGTRITDNFTMMGGDDLLAYEYGDRGACRATSALVGPIAVVAYEESKGPDEVRFGKYARYQYFSVFDDSVPDPTAGAGWIISMPEENGQCSTFIMEPGLTSGETDLRIVFLWRQGMPEVLGPADVVARFGFVNPEDPDSTGLRPQDLYPPVDPNPIDRQAAENNELPLNLSSSAGLVAQTWDDPYEDARDFRGVVRGGLILLTWKWTPDWAVARFSDLEHYNVYTRRSTDGGITWEDPVNMSDLDHPRVNAKDPRVLTTPLSADPDLPNDPDVFYVAWGTDLNQYEHLSDGPVNLDLYVSRTSDAGQTFGPIQVLAGTAVAESDAQLRTCPTGSKLFAVWQERGVEVAAQNTMYRGAVVQCVADFNKDGVLNILDFVAFQVAFQTGDMAADVNLDGELNVLDFVTFQGIWQAGCE